MAIVHFHFHLFVVLIKTKSWRRRKINGVEGQNKKQGIFINNFEHLLEPSLIRVKHHYAAGVKVWIMLVNKVPREK